MSNADELRRLRTDFETQASRYPDLTLTVDFIGAGFPNDRVFRRPNHTLPLWQFMGFSGDVDMKRVLLDALRNRTKFGVPAQITANGTVEGTDTALFVRMATRAATLIPAAAQDTMMAQITESVSSALTGEGKAVVFGNSNPVAVWLNLVLSTLAAFQRERFQSLMVSVDPFAASLAVFDHVLLPGAKNEAARFRREAPRIRTPIVLSHVNTAEPTLADATYEKILDVVGQMGVEMERHPATYVQKDEERLRDDLLIILSTHFDSATGETFNRAGKTDILIRQRGANVFVAECKIWHGAKEYLEAIDQLLSYLTWRDSKTALIMFVRNKQFQPVLDTVVKETPQHPCYQSDRQRDADNEATRRYMFRLPQDPTRSVAVAVLCFHFPER